ncbi:uncharacterized protein LOC143449989 isoform X2 [Clavelina lepadiformis]|uniref:uncharacterized protein LOC143449989 isoform X2 n=1 Tax=Clavelina lepadiformis TaxID=159417 RepID=UPI004041F813
MSQNRVVLCLVSILIYKAAPINGNICGRYYTATSAVDTFSYTDPCIEVTKFSSEPAVVLVQGGTIPNGEDCKIYQGFSLDMEDLLGVIKSPGIGWVDVPEGSTFTVDCTSAANIVIGIMEVEYNSTEVSLPTPGTTAYVAEMSEYPTNFTNEVVFRSSVQCTFNVQQNGNGMSDDDWLFMLPDEDSPDAGIRVGGLDAFGTGETRSLQAKTLKLQLATFGMARDQDNYSYRITANESCVQDFPPTEPPPPTPSLELECGEDGEVKISLSNDTLDDLQVEENDAIVISSLPVHDLNSIDPECVANSTHPEFNLGITNCSSVESTGDLLQATFTVRRHIYFNQSQPIQRYNDYCVNLTCEWNLTVLVNSSAIFPEIKKVQLDAVEKKGEFDVGISFTNDSTYSTELPENSAVKVSDYVHVKVDLTGVDLDSSLHLQLTDCWARPSEIATGSPMYSIINDSCPADNSFDPDDAIMIDRNYDVKYSTFKFRSFVWTQDQEQAIYVYCDVTICHNDVGSGCASQPACPGDKRRKRDLESSQSQHRVVASGPIFIAQNRKEKCEEFNGGCSDVCELRHDDVICSCYNGRKLQENGKICEAENHELVEIFEEKNDSILFAAVALVALVTIVVGIVLKQRSKSKNVLNVA